MPAVPRVRVSAHSIFIDNGEGTRGTAAEVETVFSFDGALPAIRIFENDRLTRSYTIETLDRNPDLTGQFLHSSIRIFGNGGVMIDGIISADRSEMPKPEDPVFEGIRFQPFFLSDNENKNRDLKGKSLFDRGLHFRGRITPTSIRSVCACDECTQSFTLCHFHAGFSGLQYFYSGDARETLVVPYGALPHMPGQLQSPEQNAVPEDFEQLLPRPVTGSGSFRYYNPFRCPHCQAPFIDFEAFPAIRPDEYYGNTLINISPTRWPG